MTPTFSIIFMLELPNGYSLGNPVTSLSASSLSLADAVEQREVAALASGALKPVSISRREQVYDQTLGVG